jgi:hypothetical protein
MFCKTFNFSRAASFADSMERNEYKRSVGVADEGEEKAALLGKSFVNDVLP